MNIIRTYATEKEAITAYAERNKSAGLLSKGVHVGKGRHVTIHDDPRVSTLGWTITCVSLVTNDKREVALVASSVDGPLAGAVELKAEDMERWAEKEVSLDAEVKK